MSKIPPLSQLPAIDEILRSEKLDDLVPAVPHATLVSWARAAVAHYRSELREGAELSIGELCDSIVARIRRSHAADNDQTLQHVINATGVLLHTNLGRAPLAPIALERMQQVAAYTNLEMDLSTGKRSRRGARALRLLAELTGAEDAVVVNNCAAATVLVLQALAACREVIVSRGQLIEIGGGFRLPEVFASSGAILREVGTTNRTYVRDYAQALSERTAAILRVHRSNFAQTGFVAEPTIQDLVAFDKPAHVAVIDDLGSGCVVDLARIGIREPTVMQSVSSGADLCLFSGDKLFAGPQCGIIVGRKNWISQLSSHPMMRALRADKLTLAALEATTEIHLSGNSFRDLPLYQMLGKPLSEIRERCEQLQTRLRHAVAHVQVEVLECDSQIGGGSLPGVQLPSFGIGIQSSSNQRLSAALRRGRPAIQCRQAEDRLLLDLRTVQAHEWETLATQLVSALLSLDGAQS